MFSAVRKRLGQRVKRLEQRVYATALPMQ